MKLEWIEVNDADLIIYSAKEGSFLGTEARWTIALVVLLLLRITAVGLSHEANMDVNGHGALGYVELYTSRRTWLHTDCMARRFGRHKHTRGEWG
jgi:hypothetical protein